MRNVGRIFEPYVHLRPIYEDNHGGLSLGDTGGHGGWRLVAHLFLPRWCRSWPGPARLLLGVLTAAAAAYAFLFLVIRPLIAQQFAAHHGNIVLDYQIDMVPLWGFPVFAIPISCLIYFVRACISSHAAY